MKFNDRTSYIAATTAWKQAYAEHSIALRKMKLDFKQSQRDGNDDRAIKLRYAITNAKRKAFEMIEARHQGKREAQAQYLASKRTAIAA